MALPLLIGLLGAAAAAAEALARAAEQARAKPVKVTVPVRSK